MSRSDRAERVGATGRLAVDIPPVPDGGSKHDRGRVLVVGGSRETPGAVLLAASAAFRVGAGVVQVATARSAASALAIAVPETRVVPLDETEPTGAITGGERVTELAGHADAVLVGSGTLEPHATRSLVTNVIEGIGRDTIVVLDAAALDVVGAEPDLVARCADRVVLMPNPNEAARLLGSDDAGPQASAAMAQALVERFGAVVAVRASDTWVASPHAAAERFVGGHQLLGVSGSGDVLAGALVGFAARGCTPFGAAVAAVIAHARAAEVLAAQGPQVGRYARELLAVLPAVTEALERLTVRPARPGTPADTHRRPRPG